VHRAKGPWDTARCPWQPRIMTDTDMDRPKPTGSSAPESATDAGHRGACDCAVPGDTDPVDMRDDGASTACAPCVARLAPLPERIAAVQAAIAVEAEPLVTITHLLQLCRDEHPVLWERLNDPLTRARVAPILSDVLAALPPASTAPVLSLGVRGALAAALTAAADVPAVVVARTLAELVDERYAHSFTASFRRRSPYQPGVGDPIPLDSPDLRQVTELPATSPPWRLANRLDETRHLRLAGEWAAQFQVIFDYRLSEALTGLLGPDTIVAIVHPNRTLAEFEFPVDARGRTFPIRPVDEQRQRNEINQLITTAVAAGANIVVLPELCVTESLATQLGEWTSRANGPRLLVAGSYHHDDAHRPGETHPHGGPWRRRNTAVAYVRGYPLPLMHDKHSPADRPVAEDIEPQGWPQLRVYVSEDGWHLVIAICRDLLNPHAVHALTEAGVNLALVPAMSETLVAFGGPVAHLVGSAQAFVAVANNPADFADSSELTARRPARALFGHPGFGQQTRLVQPSGDEPGLALLHVRTGQLQWLPAPPPGTPPVPESLGSHDTQPGPVLPEWATQLGRLTRTAPALRRPQPARITLRPAAVLVLLTDSPDGPAALLTERAPDLTHYPGQLVFPGGAADPGDDGPVTTALREAAEEIGLDPASVHILGILPALALPDSGFLLTPVLGWSSHPVFTSSVNVAEVSVLATIPLRRLNRPDIAPQPVDTATDVAAVEPIMDRPLGAVGTVTGFVLDLVTGMLARPNDRPSTTAAVDLERALA